jgi:hypothetical protein
MALFVILFVGGGYILFVIGRLLKNLVDKRDLKRDIHLIKRIYGKPEEESKGQKAKER